MSTINYTNSFRQSDGLQRFDCVAWVNFNGTGTVAIRAAGNVSSITDNGVGDYTINFTTPFQDASYSIAGACTATVDIVNAYAIRPRTDSDVLVGSIRVTASSAAGAAAKSDPSYASLVVFR